MFLRVTSLAALVFAILDLWYSQYFLAYSDVLVSIIFYQGYKILQYRRIIKLQDSLLVKPLKFNPELIDPNDTEPKV